MNEPIPAYDRTSVAAILLRRNREDRDALFEELVTLLSGTVPGVQVQRSLLRRRVKVVRMPVGDAVYVLARGPNNSFEASRHHAVRGIVVRTDPMPIDGFLAELGAAIDDELRRTEQGRDVLQSWLNSTNP